MINNLSSLLLILLFAIFPLRAMAEGEEKIYDKRALSVYCNQISIVLKKAGGDFTEAWIDSDKNEWYTYTDFLGKIMLLIRPADKPETLCIVSLGKSRNLKSSDLSELPK
jgi:hypothetical protein